MMVIDDRVAVFAPANGIHFRPGLTTIQANHGSLFALRLNHWINDCFHFIKILVNMARAQEPASIRLNCIVGNVRDAGPKS